MKKERDAFIPMGFRDVEVVRCPPHLRVGIVHVIALHSMGMSLF